MDGMVSVGDTCFYYPITQAFFGCMSSAPADHSDNEAAIKAAHFMGYLVSVANESFATLYAWSVEQKGERCGVLNSNLTQNYISSWEKEYIDNLSSSDNKFSHYYLFGAIGGAAFLAVLAIAATLIVRNRKKAYRTDVEAGVRLVDAFGNQLDSGDLEAPGLRQ